MRPAEPTPIRLTRSLPRLWSDVPVDLPGEIARLRSDVPVEHEPKSD